MKNSNGTMPCDRTVLVSEDLARRRRQAKGNLYREGNWWRLRWREDFIGENGEPKRSRRSVIIGPCRGPEAITQRQAERISWDMVLSKIDAFTSCPKSMMTLSQFVERRFEPDVVWTMKRSGQLHYKYCLSKIIPAMGNMRLCDVTSGAITSLIRKMHAENFSTQTLLHIKNAVSAIFTHAKSIEHYTGDNPASLVKTPEMVQSERTAYTWEQAQEILEKLESPIREMALLSMTTSVNVAELCGIRWKRVNLSDESILSGGEVIPPRSIAIRENFYAGQWGTVKTGRRKRMLPLPPDAIPLLAGLALREKFTGPDDPVFSGRNGNPIDRHNASNRSLKAAGKAIGITVNWHAFRHTFATMSEQVGMAKSDRIAMMGHGAAAMTDHYTHSDIERRRDGVTEIARRILEKKSPAPDIKVSDMHRNVIVIKFK
jgi:integrase